MESDEGFLADVVGVVAGSEHADDGRRDGSLVAIDEHGERPVVTGTGARDQLGVGCGFRHQIGRRAGRTRLLRQGMDNLSIGAIP